MRSWESDKKRSKIKNPQVKEFQTFFVKTLLTVLSIIENTILSIFQYFCEYWSQYPILSYLFDSSICILIFHFLVFLHQTEHPRHFCLKLMKDEYFFKNLEIFMNKIDMKNSRLGTETCESGERFETTLFLEKVANFSKLIPS